MNPTIAANVEKLIDKAAQAEDSNEAMRFAQAALNSANAGLALSNAKPEAK